MKTYQKPAPAWTWDTGHVIAKAWNHTAQVRNDRGKRWVVSCAMSGTFPGEPNCTFLHTFTDVGAAREAADAHMIFTHVTGGRECGNSRCTGCQAIRRQSRTSRGGEGAS